MRTKPFDAAACPDASLNDLSTEKLDLFLSRAQSQRGYPLPPGTAMEAALAHFNLLDGRQPSHASVLLFGRDPQRFLLTSEVKCLHFHGTEVRKPIPSYQIYKGTVFELVDQALDFVMSKIARRVGTRALGPEAPVDYELPREAIVNAVAHRDYASGAAVQVSVFSDRVEVWNPGALPPGLTPARLREPHGSVARNPRICEALFLTRYIEKYGTGTLMMIRESVAHGLPEPRFEQRGGELVVTVWRDWLTEQRLAKLGLNERQKNALLELRTAERITNADYQRVSGAARKTATRDLADLVHRGILERIGLRKAAHYVLRKQ